MIRSACYDKKRQSEAQRAWLDGIIAAAQERNWYGSLTVRIEQGEIRRVVKEESLVPPIPG